MDSKALLQNWIEAFQRWDVDAVVACYSDDAVNFQVAAGEPAVGIERIRLDTAEFFKVFPTHGRGLIT